MNKFIGIWYFHDEPLAIPQNIHSNDNCTLHLKFTHQPKEVQSDKIIEYRTGDAFPEPTKGMLVDPQYHAGVYEWIHFDGADHRVRCGTDYMGIGRVYYAPTPGKLLFSNDLFLLAQETGITELSMLGCTMLLGIGECLEQQTLIDGIYRLGHGEILELDRKEFKVISEWQLSPPETTKDPGRFIADNNELFLTALKYTEAWSGQRTCLMSGGDDSRRIAAGLDIIGINADFISQRYVGPGGWDEDTIPAQMIAKSLNKPLKIIELCTKKEIEKDIFVTLQQTNAESLLHNWLQKTLRHVAPGSLLYDGLAGGELMNGHFVKKFPECAKQYYQPELLAETVLAQCSFNLRPALKDALGSAVLESFIKTPETPYRMTLFYLYNHTRRNTGSVSALMREHGLVPYMPFITKDLAIQSLSLDYQQHFNDFYQGVATRELLPRLAEIPRTRIGFSDKYKIDLRHKSALVGRSELLIGKTNLALINSLLSRKESILMFLLDILGLHEKYSWRSVPLRRVGLIADVVSKLGTKNNQINAIFTLEKKYKHD